MDHLQAEKTIMSLKKENNATLQEGEKLQQEIVSVIFSVNDFTTMLLQTFYIEGDGTSISCIICLDICGQANFFFLLQNFSYTI